MFCIGAVKNAALTTKVYPGWKCVFYVDYTVPKEIMQELKSLKVEVRQSDERIKNGMFWRFLINDDPSVERFIVRDCDSRLSQREAKAVKEWIDSGLDWHVMGDHPAHSLPIGGGLFGGKTDVVKDMTGQIIRSGCGARSYDRATSYCLDQIFLARYIYPLVKKSLLRHDSCTRQLYPDARPFPDGCKFGEDRFVGEIVNPDDTPHPVHFQQRTNFQHA